MDRLWAPWRMAYVGGPPPEGCFLCRARDSADDRADRVLWRGERSFVVMNIYPYNNGHLMAATALHAGSLEALGALDRADLMETVNRCVEALRGAFRPDAFNVGLNLGRAAGAGLEDHLHVHVVPRWNGDCNFMPVLGETKVISQHLDETYEKLRPFFA
jgi:ATP adenylyltransferase